MVAHALASHPNESCGVLLGRQEDGVKTVTTAVPLDNAAAVHQTTRYESRPADLLAADRLAGEEDLAALGLYRSHTDCAACFSETDLEHSCP